MAKMDVLNALRSGNDESFSEALWSAGMFADASDLDEILSAAVEVASEPIHWWAIAEAIVASTQARRLVPSDADAILAAIPDASMAANSRDEAREVIEIVRARSS